MDIAFVMLNDASSPYFGQCGYFKVVNPSPHFPQVIERYQKEIIRVLGVLEDVLSKKKWLVGDKCTIADISFIPYVKLPDQTASV